MLEPDTSALVRAAALAGTILLGCGGSSRSEVFDKSTELTPPPPKPEVKTEPAPAPSPELDGLMNGTPTFLYGEASRTIACSGSVRRGTDVTHRIELFDPTGASKGDRVELRPGDREFAKRRQKLDQQLGTGFTKLPRAEWPARARELELGEGRPILRWTERGAIAVVVDGKAVRTVELTRRDLIPLVAHTGGEFVVLEVGFDPKDKKAADASSRECVIVPLQPG